MTPTLPFIKTALQNGDLDSAAQQLLTFAQASHPRLASEVIGYMARLKQIATDERKGVVSADVTLMRKNQMLYALLDLIEVMEEEGKASEPGVDKSDVGKSITIGGNATQVIIVQGDNNVVTKHETGKSQDERL